MTAGTFPTNLIPHFYLQRATGACDWMKQMPNSPSHPLYLANIGMLGHFEGLVQERRNYNALAIEFRLSCTNQSIYEWMNENWEK